MRPLLAGRGKGQCERVGGKKSCGMGKDGGGKAVEREGKGVKRRTGKDKWRKE